MAHFISTKNPSYYPKVGDIVVGMAGKRLIKGKVIGSKSNPSKPAIFQRFGFVGLYVECEDGKIRAVNEISPVE